MSKAEQFANDVREFNESEQTYNDYIRFIMAVKKVFDTGDQLGGCSIEKAVQQGLE